MGLFFASWAVEGLQIPRSWDDLWPILALTLCVQVIGHNMLTHCQGKLSVNLSAVICLCQPAIAAVYSWAIFSEKLSGLEVLGIAVVLVGVYIVKKQYSPSRDKAVGAGQKAAGWLPPVIDRWLGRRCKPAVAEEP